MKEKIIKLVTLSILLLIGITINTNMCYAEEDFINNFELLYQDKNDYNEIKELEPQVKALINQYILLNNDKKNKEDIKLDMKKAYKVHEASNLLNISGDSMDDIKTYLDKTDVVWVIFAKCGDDEFKVQIAKNKALDNDPWCVQSVESVSEMDVFKYKETIQTEVKKNNINLNNKKIILCSGIKYMNSAVAIVGNKKAEAFIPTGELEIVGSQEQINTLKYKEKINDSYTFKYKKMKKALILTEDGEILNGGVPKIILTDAILNDEDIVETTNGEISTQSSSEELTTTTDNKHATKKNYKESNTKKKASNKNSIYIILIIIATLFAIGIGISAIKRIHKKEN